MRGIKLLAAFLMSAAMLVCTAPLSGFEAYAATQAVTVVVKTEGQIVDTMTYEGVTVNAIYTPRDDSNAAGMYDDPVYCCAALVTKFYNAVYGVTVYNLWPGSTPLVTRGSFSKVKTPQVGDIYGNSTHWAIVKKVNGSEVVLFEQNWTWYDSNGTYAKYNRTVDLNNLESDVSFFRYSEADIPAVPVIKTDYASLAGSPKAFSWTTGSKTVKSTLSIYKYNSAGAYGDQNLVSSTPNITTGKMNLVLDSGHYTARVINYSSSGKSSSSGYKEFHAVSEPLAKSISLNASSSKIAAGSTLKLTASTSPAKNNDIITWSSSDTSVASVSNQGEVKGLRAGTAVITAKTVSGKSSTCTVTVKPQKVLGVKVSARSASSLTLSWNPQSDVSGYKVYMLDKSSGKYKLAVKTQTASAKISGLSRASEFTFKVRAYRTYKNKNYNGSYSSPLTAATKPKAPTGVKVKANSAVAATVSWSQADGANGYAVYAKAAGQAKYKKMAEVSKKTTSVKIKGLSKGTVYSFKVKTIKKTSNESVLSGYSKEAVTATKPGKPKITKAVSKKTGTAKIKWTSQSGADEYVIYASSGDKYFYVKNISASKLKATVKNLVPGKNYSFKVRAVKYFNGKCFYGKFSAPQKVSII